jgi:AcrR family transcriptional regulator
LETLPPARVTRAAVARHAGVDPSLIRYYFRDRDSLLLAVLQNIVGDRPREILQPRGENAAERLRELVTSIFLFIAEQPYVHRLLIEEIATSDSAEARQAFHRLNHGAIDGYAKILKEGVADGSLRKADPLLLHVAIIGMCEFFFESRVLLEDALGKTTAPQKLSKRYAAMISQLVTDGLRPR